MEEFNIYFNEENCRCWTCSDKYNRTTIRRIGEVCNRLLDKRGFYRLNEIYEDFGMYEDKYDEEYCKNYGWIKGDLIKIDIIDPKHDESGTMLLRLNPTYIGDKL